MPAQRNTKQKRNITGLRNQPRAIPDLPMQPPLTPVVISEGTQNQINPELEDHRDEDCEEGPVKSYQDSLKSTWEEEDKGKVEAEIIDEEDTEEEFNSDRLYVKLMNLAMENGDDPRDENWIPENLRRRKKQKKGIESHLLC
ncbi:hypothetical protein BDZ94DRAFT_1313815 [Collybia nuda]|uniref:Uncharacterized protein n=1 Tax=Collybia nuda TaxID=64659 RepID=A0A9P5XWA5_9AGAR|nr:hypothetical protein BDZ94DRAFT_1313815 [Collybia nuda]